MIGIAYTRPEALELARRIVDEVYQKTGDCDIGAYIRNRTDTP